MDEPVTLDITLDDLTIDEVIEFERITGLPIEMAVIPGAKRGPATKALVFLALRRTRPDITLDDVGKLKFSTITAKAATTELDPTGPGAS